LSGLLRNFFSVLIGRIGGHGLTVIASIYLARVLHPEGYGVVGFLSSYTSLFMLLAALGIPLYGARELAKMADLEEKARFTGVWMGMNLLFAFTAYFLFAVSLWLLPLEPIIKRFGTIWGWRLVLSGASCYWVFQAHEKMGFVGLRDLLRGLLFCGAVVALIRSSEQLLSVAWLNFGSVLAGELLLLIFLFKGLLGFAPRLSFHRRGDRGSLRHVFQIGFALLMAQIYYRTDSVIIEFIKGEKYVGLYTAMYQLIFVGESIAVLYFASILPRISSLWQDNKENLSSLLEFSMSVFVTLGCLLGIVGLLFSRDIIHLVYGADYASSHGAFAILIWSMVMTYTALTPTYFLMGTQYQKACSRATMTAAMVNLVLNFPLIIYYGIHGAALATVVSKVTEFAYIRKKANEKIALNWKKGRILRLSLAVVLTLGIGILSRSYEVSAILSTTAVCVSYFAAILGLRVVSISKLRRAMESIEA
jgi:O-antigen/teichoic acid export membrane protein